MVAKQFLAEHSGGTIPMAKINYSPPPSVNTVVPPSANIFGGEDVKTSDSYFNENVSFQLTDNDGIIGVMQDKMETMEKSDVLRNNLVQQQIEIEKQISVLEGQLQRQKEYLAKIEGGLDVLDELKK